MIRLNIGCGYKKLKGWINIDISKDVNPDKIWDINKKSDFLDGSVDEIYTRHTFQYVRDPVKVLKEFYRICKDDALITIVVVFGDSWQDNMWYPIKGYHPRSFDKFDKQTRGYYKLPLLKVEKVICRTSGIMRFVPFKKILSRFLNNIYYEIEYQLRVIKS